MGWRLVCIIKLNSRITTKKQGPTLIVKGRILFFNLAYFVVNLLLTAVKERLTTTSGENLTPAASRATILDGNQAVLAWLIFDKGERNARQDWKLVFGIQVLGSTD